MNAHVEAIELPAGTGGQLIGTEMAEPGGHAERREAVASASPVPVLHRDPIDVRTILGLTWSGILLALLLVVSIGANLYQYWRRPDRIVVDRSSGRVLMINDREYGETEAVSFGPDKLTNADKQYLAGEFVRALYQIDPATRNKDIERALRMMVPNSALKFAQHLKRTGTLDRQRAESQQAIWTPQDISVDRADPYTVRVIGKQEITKVISGTAQTETRQLSLQLKLAADRSGRADRNLRSGFLVARFDDKELSSPTSADISANQ